MASEFSDVEKIWMDGEFVDWKDATIHVLTHALHYGSGAFEGIRCYGRDDNSYIFRLEEHVKRLYMSAGMYKMVIPYSMEEFKNAIIETVRVNKLTSCYIRPIVYYGYHHLGLNPKGCPVKCTIATWPWGAYLGEEGIEQGIRCTFTSWVKIHSKMIPISTAKGTGQYINSLLAVIESRDRGFDEAIMLDNLGYVAEGPGENIFMVKDGVIHTPDLGSSILPGITRDTVITLANDQDYKIIERKITKGELLAADEIFFTGSAAEITPVRIIDYMTIGEGKRGPVTKDIQERYNRVILAHDERYTDWVTKVY
ncbi:MAG: branched-chain amino acid transaminase [Halobacteriota archaeon]|nr:branched-chain amino acid transaminase [Halobacteriota archaeon]